MTSQNEKQTITENILLNISSGKDCQAMRFSQFIEYNTFFLKNHTQNLVVKLVPDSSPK